MLSHLKRRLGVFTAIAVMAALVPALATSTVSAAVALAPTAADSGAEYSACPTGSAPAAGFTDTTSTDVDCIKMHGITTGVTATTYEPASNIPRFQMALYLTRFATAAGVTLGSGADQGFTDISGYTAAIQTAINQIKQLGVTAGTTATTFSPADNVTREQMAMFVERMLGLTVAGPGGSGANAGYTGLITTATLVYNYTDIDAGAVTYEGHNAIAETYNLGIAGDAKTVTTFSPTADITRADMATWITNALAHTNARPAGVWTQIYGATANTTYGSKTMVLHVSHRDTDRAAVPGTLVDIFSDLTYANTDPFSATTGACTIANTTELGNVGGTAATECIIDLGDKSTDTQGNIGGSAGTTGGSITAATTVTYWAHTGATGTAYNNLTTTGVTALARSQATDIGVLVLTNNIPTYNVMDGTDALFELVKYGTSVTITGTAKTNATAAGTVVAKAVVVKVVDTVISLADDGAGTDNDAGDVTLSVTTTAGATGADGVWTHTLTQADPTPVGTALAATTSRTQTTSVITVDLDGDGIAADVVATVSISWDDNPSVQSTVTLTEGNYYGLGLPLLTYGGVARTATATAYDQFGVGMANVAVTFTSAATTGSTAVTDAFTDSTVRNTDSTGVATLSYTDVQTATAKQVTTATATTAGTSTFYRIDGTTPAFAETETATSDGTAVANNFNIAAGSTGLVTFGGVHSLSVGDEITVGLGLLTAAVGANWTLTNTTTDEFIASAVHNLEVGDVLKFTTAPAGVSGAGMASNDFVCVRTVVSTTIITLTANLGTPDNPCSATDTLLPITSVSSGDGVAVSVAVPLGHYYVATVPTTATATLSVTRGANALGPVYTTYTSDLVGASSSGTAKLTSATEYDTGDLYMEAVINDAAGDKIVVENKLTAADWNYHVYTYEADDQFNLNGDHGAGKTATTMAGFETAMAAKFSALTGVPTAKVQGDIFAITYLNAAAGGGVSVFTAGS